MRRMKTPIFRQEFERRCFILSELINNRKISFPPENKRVIGSAIMKIKKLPNRRVNLLTIDEEARLIINTVVDMEKN
jgi:hypothetical protein